MNKDFNYKKELKRMFHYIGSEQGDCNVDCDGCAFCNTGVGKGKCCYNGKYAEECIEIIRKWSEEHAREIDWRKVPRDTPVKVRDQVWDEWQERKFAWHRADIFECRFVTFGLYEEAYFGDTENLDRWKYCKLADGVEPKEEWYKD